LIETLAARAKGRFVHWDEALWREVVAGPAAELAAGLASSAAGAAADVEPVLASYLTLACEAIGLGYLFPRSTGVESFFTVAWRELAPRLLPRLRSSREQVDTLAALWNLGENLEASPVWMRRIFTRLFRAVDGLDDLAGRVAAIERRAEAAPSIRLGEDARATWVHLGAEDRRFLPGAAHFVVPTVVCVHDRQRTGGGGREASTLGVWIAGGGPPLILGAMACGQAVAPGDLARVELWDRLARTDPRFDEPFAVAVNDWIGVATLETSQLLVVLSS
jgi:hypothetical protein